MIKKIKDIWNGYFFEPISPATIGIFRIFFGLVIFLAVLGRFPFRDIFYGADAIVRSATTARFFPGNPIFYFRWVPETDPALKYYFLGILTATVCLILGFLTRISSILVFLGLISLSNRNLFIDNAGDDLMRINCLFLMFTHAGDAYSIDKWLRVKFRKETPELIKKSPWAQRMLQLQVAYLYFDTFILKLPGAGWQDGTAMYYALNYLELRRFRFPFLFYYLWQIKLMTYTVLVGEFALSILIWFRKLRYPILVIGVLLHIGINLTMQFPIFQYVMIASLINFIYPEDLENLILKTKLWRQGNRSPVV